MKPLACVLALALAARAGALCTGKPCCSDCSTGAAYSNCACLEDNTPVDGHVVEPGAYRRYHYRITDWSLTSSEDRKIAFRLTPCHGSAHLLINPAPNGFPTNASTRWRSDRFGEENQVVVDLDYEQYFVSVFGVTETNYTVKATTDGSHNVSITEHANVTVSPSVEEKLILAGDTMSMDVTFPPSPEFPDARYRVYYMERATSGDAVCAPDSAAPSQCVLMTPCGVEKRMTPFGDWFTPLPSEALAGAKTVTVDGLRQDTRYSFTVMMEASDGRREVMTGTDATPHSTRVSSAQSPETMMIVGIVVGCVVVTLVLLLILARSRLRQAYHVKRH